MSPRDQTSPERHDLSTDLDAAQERLKANAKRGVALAQLTLDQELGRVA